MLALPAVAGCPGETGNLNACAGVTCAPGRVCVDGKCQEQVCTGGDCPAGTVCSGGQCVATCGAGSFCTGGAVCCGGLCALLTDAGACPDVTPGDGPSLGDGPPAGDGPAPADSGPPAGDGPVDQFVKPDAGPSCGDKVCNNGETCVDCPGDCGACPCTPGQTETSSTGCQPCQQKSRSCLSTGQWGAWGGCAFYCTGTYFCVNNQCKPCYPGTTEKQTCPCGEQTRTCSASGDWSSWGSCVTVCSGTFTCSSDRCVKEYTAYESAGGPECGSKYMGSGVYTYYRCQPGDLCVSSSQKKCLKYEAPQPGDVYTSFTAGKGAECGSKYLGSGVYQYYRCLPGDLCKSSSQKQCAYSGTACNALYTSAAASSGAACGSKYLGSSVYQYYYCLPGDYCVSSSQKSCKIITTCGAGAQYHAYASAGGAKCGSKYLGSGVYTYYYCKPLDTCKSSSQKLCQQ